MKESFGKALVDRMIQLGIGQPETVVGCNQDEICDLMDDQHVSTLPKIYREFLRYAGKQAGGIWVGTDAFYPRLLGAKTIANALLQESNLDALPDTAFVFLNHEDYQFMYFDSTVVDNPDIFQYIEGMSYFIR